MFHGKRESEWIAGIKYPGDDEQTKQWQSFGPDGIRILCDGLHEGNGTFRRAYRDAWPKLPAFFQAHLSPPDDSTNSSHRMRSAMLLAHLGTNALSALPALERSLEIERRGGARGIVVDCFTELLPQMKESEKLKVLPYFIKGLESNDESERNNSAIALGFYQKQADQVVPALAKALNDPRPHISLMAAQSLNQVDITAADRADVIPTVIGLLKKKDTLQTPLGAATLLGEIGQRQPDLVLPALIEAARSTNGEVNFSAIYALARFKDQTNQTVPVLVELSNDPNKQRSSPAKHVLRQLSQSPRSN